MKIINIRGRSFPKFLRRQLPNKRQGSNYSVPRINPKFYAALYVLLVVLTLLASIFIFFETLSASFEQYISRAALFRSWSRERKDFPQTFQTQKEHLTKPTRPVHKPFLDFQNVTSTTTTTAPENTTKKRRLSIPEAISQVKYFALENQIQKFTKTKKKKLIFIITAWRSGSSFLGEGLASHPAVFYHFEPLMHLTDRKLGDGHEDEVQSAYRTLANLAKCDYDKADGYTSALRSKFPMVLRNDKIRSQCFRLQSRCFNHTFLSETCAVFPVQLFKLVRLRASAILGLMKRFPNAKFLYLARDPRATFSSRSKVSWCTIGTGCKMIETFCRDLRTDELALRSLPPHQSKRVFVVKYEQLALNPLGYFQSLFEILDLEWHERVRKYVREHTRANSRDPMSTVKKSATRVDAWKRKLRNETVRQIEEQCRSFMLTFNYTLEGEDEEYYEV